LAAKPRDPFIVIQETLSQIDDVKRQDGLLQQTSAHAYTAYFIPMGFQY